MIEVNVDYGKTLEALDSVPDAVVRAVGKKMRIITVDLQGYVVSQKLQGQVLNHRSGKLSRSIQQAVETEGTKVTGDVFSAGDVKYAGIHEFGGVIPAHDIEAKNAKALAFMIDGKMVFAKRVHIPDVTMPERSYLRSSLADKKDEIVAGIQAAALFGAKEAMGE